MLYTTRLMQLTCRESWRIAYSSFFENFLFGGASNRVEQASGSRGGSDHGTVVIATCHIFFLSFFLIFPLLPHATYVASRLTVVVVVLPATNALVWASIFRSPFGVLSESSETAAIKKRLL